MNDTPSSERTHIGIFGRTNAGKSSLINAITNQHTAIVSDTKGTTTDPVNRTMEILPLGPCVITDTGGIDDVGELGKMRINAAKHVLETSDIALIVIGDGKITEHEKNICNFAKSNNIPYIIVYSKSDIYGYRQETENDIFVSAKENKNIARLRIKITEKSKLKIQELPILSDFIHKGETVLLIIPIDKAAPKGRLILPQQMVIRDILDSNAKVIITKEDRITETLENMKTPPVLAITDSQVFKKAAHDIPENIGLTSFSVLMARHKGILKMAVDGAKFIDAIKDHDKILISEGCTHHRQCGDIGTIKLPKLIEKYTSKKPKYNFTSGKDFPDNLSEYNLIIHCGGCMLTTREMVRRNNSSIKQNIHITNYGTAIAYMNGILERSIKPLPEFEL